MFDKITARVRKLCYGLNERVDPIKVSMRVIEGLYDGVTTSELDNLAAEIAATMTTTHPDFAKLAARISVSNLHKNTKKSFSETMKDLYTYVNPRTGKKAPLLSDEVFKVVSENADELDSTIIYNRDFGYDYFGFKTLERSYLLKLNGKIAERPQHMLMRVSIGIHLNDLDAAIETYDEIRLTFWVKPSSTDTLIFEAANAGPVWLTTANDYWYYFALFYINKSGGGFSTQASNGSTTATNINFSNGTLDVYHTTVAAGAHGVITLPRLGDSSVNTLVNVESLAFEDDAFIAKVHQSSAMINDASAITDIRLRFSGGSNFTTGSNILIEGRMHS